MSDSRKSIIRYVASIAGLPLPESAEWLTSAEQAELAVWTNAHRRRQWLAARWVAKRTILGSTAPTELRRVEILSRAANKLGRSPRVSIDSVWISQRLSIAHAGDSVLVGLSSVEAAIGVDLAIDVPYDNAFCNAWFSPEELAWASHHPGSRVPVLWGLKEAIFKSHGEGRSWNPREVEITVLDKGVVHSELFGQRLAPLATWIRPIAGGAAAVVWQAGSSDRCQAVSAEVTACL